MFRQDKNPWKIVLTNIDIATDDLAKIGFLAWEGEAEIGIETLLIMEFLSITLDLIWTMLSTEPSTAITGLMNYGKDHLRCTIFRY